MLPSLTLAPSFLPSQYLPVICPQSTHGLMKSSIDPKAIAGIAAISMAGLAAILGLILRGSDVTPLYREQKEDTGTRQTEQDRQGSRGRRKQK